MPSNLICITDDSGNHCNRNRRLFTFLSILIWLAGINVQPAFAQSPMGKSFTVTIDAGHGGKDTGAPGKKSKEKDIALKIALKLGNLIESQMEDVAVFYTRKTDVFIDLDARGLIASRNKSDLFISIHVNAVEKNKSAAIGASTYVMGFSRSAKNLDLVMQENKAILLEQDYQSKYAHFDPTSPESYILFNNVQNNNLTQSLEIATIVQEKFRTYGNRNDMGVHQGNLIVLWGCANPSILIETGFISNPQEEAFLMTDEGQNTIASSIYMAFRQYKESVDDRVSVLAKTSGKKEGQAQVTETKNESSDNREKVAEPVKRPDEKEKTSLKDIERKDLETEKTEAKDTGKVIDPQVNTIKSHSVQSDIEYRIQIMASTKKLPLNAKDFKGVKNLNEIRSDGYYKYMTQPVSTYKEALELRRKLSTSFRGAFVVAFKNGERVPLDTETGKEKK